MGCTTKSPHREGARQVAWLGQRAAQKVMECISSVSDITPASCRKAIVLFNGMPTPTRP